ncbi:hypothetical protein FRC08_009145 [Ceratobasidium sp. 394]|nr:hypothetical protein FRC08_009145 [Ceratobasidium sp. 394]
MLPKRAAHSGSSVSFPIYFGTKAEAPSAFWAPGDAINIYYGSGGRAQVDRQSLAVALGQWVGEVLLDDVKDFSVCQCRARWLACTSQASNDDDKIVWTWSQTVQILFLKARKPSTSSDSASVASRAPASRGGGPSAPDHSIMEVDEEEPEPKPKLKSLKPKPKPKPESESEPEPEPESEPKSEPESEPECKFKPEPEPEPEPKSKSKSRLASCSLELARFIQDLSLIRTLDAVGLSYGQLQNAGFFRLAASLPSSKESYRAFTELPSAAELYGGSLPPYSGIKALRKQAKKHLETDRTTSLNLVQVPWKSMLHTN